MMLMNRYNFLMLFAILLLIPLRGFAQNHISALQPRAAFSSAQLDTNRLLSDKPLKSPRGAMLRSAVLPGWGQFYNHKYVKAGIAFSLNAFLGYHIYWYDQRWEDTGNKDFQGKRNLYTWYFALAYLLTMADSYVDAYLYKFDEAMEISQNIDCREGKWLAEVRFSWRF